MKPENVSCLGRDSEDFRRINPHLFGASGGVETRSQDAATSGSACNINPRGRHDETEINRATPDSNAPGPLAPSIDVSVRPSTDEQKLNKLEKSYLWYLRSLRVPQLRIQAITLKLADDTRYTADFTYVDENGRMVFADTKGAHVWEDAIIKMRVAARQFTEFRFTIVTQVKRTGHFEVKEVKP